MLEPCADRGAQWWREKEPDHQEMASGIRMPESYSKRSTPLFARIIRAGGADIADEARRNDLSGDRLVHLGRIDLLASEG